MHLLHEWVCNLQLIYENLKSLFEGFPSTLLLYFEIDQVCKQEAKWLRKEWKLKQNRLRGIQQGNSSAFSHRCQ